MGPPAAKQGDRITAMDTHLILTPSGVQSLVPHPFSGVLEASLSANVRIERRAAATVGSVAANVPPHVPIGGSFVKPPSDKGAVTKGSASVRINGRPAARGGDTASTCSDPVDLPVGTVVAVGTVRIGG
jgi:uncharacterized Zn-binding protein involved in type VI secretion